MEAVTKRSPKRCREWERQRRYKFNDAITKLGEIVIAINKAKDLIVGDTVQYAKVEIIQKAILCLTDCAQEQTQLKAEILALQVQLESINSKKLFKDASHQVSIDVIKQDTATQVSLNKTDAAIQVSLVPNRRSRNGKYIKVKMLQTTKRNALKEKPVVTNVETKLQNIKPVIKEPKIFPKISLEKDKGPENTIVVLPATPFIFPQRPLLLPPMPPTIVLVNPNMQPVTRHPVQIIGRNNGDITKTTMVNILPISAYSRPLSAAKNKKSTVKLKNESNKKVAKKPKANEKNTKETNQTDGALKPADEPKPDKVTNDVSNKPELSKPEKSAEKIEKVVEDIQNAINKVTESKEMPENIINNDTTIFKTVEVITEKSSKSKLDKIKPDTPKCIEPNIPTVVPSTSSTNSVVTLMKSVSGTDSNDDGTKINKANKEKHCLATDKDKENKLPTILDTALCDGNVEGGNARLELAEEFLAASPTAAFLMSFPLVSGNRADSPAEDHQIAPQPSSKDTNQPSTPKRDEIVNEPSHFYEKSDNNQLKIKCSSKNTSSSTVKHNDQQKYVIQTPSKDAQSKPVNTRTSTSLENPFLNLPMPSLTSTNCTTTDTAFGVEFDCNINKTLPSQTTSLVSNGNLFYKSEPFSTVKNNIYSTSNITSSHEFNSLGLYPCAMEKYATKNKSDFATVEDNIMKMGPSRLTYDIDLGWSHKSLDFVTCSTSSNTFSKDILTTVSAPYSTTYNPFNPEFHVPLVSNSNKKENTISKPVTFPESLSSFYSQSTNLWTEDVPFYTSNSGSKTLPKQQNYLPVEQTQSNVNLKNNDTKTYESKQIVDTGINTGTKSTNVNLQMPDKYTKKSPNKMHINWMTSEIRPMQTNCPAVHCEPKEAHRITFNHTNQKSSYTNLDTVAKKQDHESNYFPINMHNFSAQTVQEDFQVWPPARPLGTTEISIEPPPMNLPTLVGDLALGPHDKKRNIDINRALPQAEINNCGNFLSVTQLMNRSTDNMHPRYQPSNVESSKTIHPSTKENSLQFTSESNRKVISSRPDNSLAQPCYVLNDSKVAHHYETNMTHFSHAKAKTNKPEKNSKSHKNNYSAEALIRGGGSCTQKLQDPSTKFMMPSQKYNDYNSAQDSSIAQVSHFPPIIDYSDNTYAGQQFSGTTLYNTTTNTISNSFYSNFMPGSGNLMSSNYPSAAFGSDFIDYNQATECSYSNHKYEELKMKNNLGAFHQDKTPVNYKSSRRESAAKHKMECSKKDSNKKYQSKRAKLNPEVEDWNDPSHLLWQNKATSKRHTNIMSEEMPFPNYVGNQMSTQYQPEFFNSHLMPSNMQSVGHNVDRTLSTFPVTSRANFNLSTIFPEIAMKVQ